MRRRATKQVCPAGIVIPLRRQRDEWLAQCVQSALTQSIDCDVVVVTASDTPEQNRRTLAELGEKHDRLRVVPPEKDGFAAAINHGLNTVTAPRVGLLLSDDWLEKSAVEACIALDADIVSTGSFGRDADGSLLEILTKMPTVEKYTAKPTLERKASYLQHFFLFRKSAVLAVGGVDEEIGLTGPDDYDLIWCMLENGASVGIVEQHLYNKRDHGGDRLTMRAAAAQCRDMQRIFDKHGFDGPERDALVEARSVWYGRRLQDVVRERAARRRRDGK